MDIKLASGTGTATLDALVAEATAEGKIVFIDEMSITPASPAKLVIPAKSEGLVKRNS